MTVWVTLFLLAPVASILVWLYARVLPGRWTLADTMLTGLALLLSLAAAYWALNSQWLHAGPVWQALLTAVSAYVVFLVSMAVALWWRRARAAGNQPGQRS